MPKGAETPKKRPYRREEDKSKYLGFFVLTRMDGSEAANEEDRFVQFVNSRLERVGDFHAGGTEIPSIASACEGLAKALTDVVDRFIEGNEDLFSLHEHAAQAWGVFQEREQRLRTRPRVKRNKDGRNLDVEFYGADRGLSDSQQKLLIELEKTRTVIRVVFKEQESTWLSRLVKRVQRLGTKSLADQKVQPGTQAADDHEARLERDRYGYYLEKLAEVATAGLVDPFKVDYARLALQALRDEFVSYEAEIIKNRYVQTLGLHALLYGTPFFFVYCIVRYLVPAECASWIDLCSVIHRNQGFLLLAAGACAGTWLSFSIRRVVLDFTDLAMLEDDRLRPTARIFFVIGLTVIVGMLLQTHLVGFAIGGTDVKLTSSGLLALLIGMLCGISERAMATAVSRRAEEFSQRIGGETKSTA